MYGLIHQGSWN